MTSSYPTQTQPRRLGDLLVFELHPGYQRESAYIKNASGSAVDITDPLGYPLKTDGAGGYELAFSGDEGSVIGLVLYEKEMSIAAGARMPVPIPVLTRGPAILNYSAGLPTLDAAGAAFTISTIIATLKALSPPMISLAEPTIQSTQTS